MSHSIEKRILALLALIVLWKFIAPVVLSLWDHHTQPVIERIEEAL